MVRRKEIKEGQTDGIIHRRDCLGEKEKEERLGTGMAGQVGLTGLTSDFNLPSSGGTRFICGHLL